MRVTIYARKSTSHEKAAEEAKSVTRQIDLARAFVNRQDGWIVSEDHVFVTTPSAGASSTGGSAQGSTGCCTRPSQCPAPSTCW